MPKITIDVGNVPPQEIATEIERRIKYEVAKAYRISPDDIRLNLYSANPIQQSLLSCLRKPKEEGKTRFFLESPIPVFITIETHMTAVCKKTVRRIVLDELTKICGTSIYQLISADALEDFLLTIFAYLQAIDTDFKSTLQKARMARHAKHAKEHPEQYLKKPKKGGEPGQ